MKFRNSLKPPVIIKVIAILKYIIKQCFNVRNNNQKIKYARLKEILSTSITCSWLLLLFLQRIHVVSVLLSYTKSYFYN